MTKQSKPLLVVISGKMKAGKDETAKILMELRPDISRIALADHLKVTVAEVEGISVEALEANKAVYREKLIFAGKVARTLDPETWIKHLPHEKMFHGNTVLTDARFQNEFFHFKHLGKKSHKTLFIKVHADEATRIGRGAQPEFFNDESERDLDHIPADQFDLVIDNSKHLEHTLRETVEAFVKEKLT